MRTAFKSNLFFFWAVFVLLAVQKVSAAPTAPVEKINLYQVVLPQEFAEQQTGEAVTLPSLDAQLKEGVAKLLIRLTGNRQVVYQSAYRPFLRAPKKWLKQYYFKPRLEEGVQVGQDLVLVFDRQRILQQFQKTGLIIWPYELRPKLLVVGEYEVAGVKVLLDQPGLEQHLNLDFRPVANELGLPVKLMAPSHTTLNKTMDESVLLSTWMWQTPETFQQVLPDLQSLLAKNAVEGVVLFALKPVKIPQGQGGYQLTYELYGQKFAVLPEHTLNEIVLPKTLTGTELKKLYQRMFSEVAEYFSAPYRAQASVLGEVLLTVVASEKAEQSFTPEQVFKIEQTLQDLKPTLHDAKLVQLNTQIMQFEMTYQGRFERMLEVLVQKSQLYLVSADALTGEVKMQLTKPEGKVEPSLSTPKLTPEQQRQQQLRQRFQLEFQQAVQRADTP